MILNFIGINKKNKGIIPCLILLLGCCGCSKNVNDNANNTYLSQQEYEELQRDKYYAIYEIDDDMYLYEIYNSEGSIMLRDILYKQPIIEVYDSRYVEVQWACGTGVWMNIYYDLATCFITQPIECARYIGEGIIGIVVDEEQRELHLFNPFSYSSYYQCVEIDFNTKMANPSDCIIQLKKSDNTGLQIEYWNENGEKVNKKISIAIKDE